ncbi:MAG TPA: MarR family winged helix-turn-helix transcriptional regulator [Gemmatimonadaceae bacterium]|nr:MarR family winged helix-turn-helix transcriptional regulator [Gemmatimonadaceae bacterium]
MATRRMAGTGGAARGLIARGVAGRGTATRETAGDATAARGGDVRGGDARQTEARTGDPSIGLALDALRQIQQELRVANRAVERELGLSGAQLFVLEELARAPADSLNELAARTVTRHNSVSGVVSRLVAAELVARQVGADDARRTQLGVTAAARRLLAKAPPSAQARLLAALRTLPAAQRRQLADALTAWCDAFVCSTARDGAPAARAPAAVSARPAAGRAARSTGAMPRAARHRHGGDGPPTRPRR